MVHDVPAGRFRRLAGIARLAIATAAAAMLLPSLAFAQLPPQQLMASLDANIRLDPTLRGFYIARGYRPLWIEGDAPNEAAEALYKLIATAQYDGLSRKALQADKLRGYLKRARGGDADDLAKAELAFSNTFAAYVQGTRATRDSGMSYQSNLLAPIVPSANAALTAAAAAPSLTRYIDEMAWMHPFYGRLRAALAARELGRDDTELVQLNLERARAIPANPAARYVLVDTAGKSEEHTSELQSR